MDNGEGSETRHDREGLRRSARTNFGVPPNYFGDGQRDLIPRPPPLTRRPENVNQQQPPEEDDHQSVANAEAEGGVAAIPVPKPRRSLNQQGDAGGSRASSVASRSSANTQTTARSVISKMKMEENDAEIDRLVQNMEAKFQNASHRIERLKLENTMLQRELWRETFRNVDRDGDKSKFMESEEEGSEVDEGQSPDAFEYVSSSGEHEQAPAATWEKSWTKDDDLREVFTGKQGNPAGGKAKFPFSGGHLSGQSGSATRGYHGQGPDFQYYYQPKYHSTPCAPPPVPKPRMRGRIYGGAGQASTEATAKSGETGDISSSVDSLAKALIAALSVQNKASEKFIARQSTESKLPAFGGNPLDWPIFINHYRQSTLDCGYTPAQNMGRLEKCLKGEARRSVQALMITPSNANAVIAALEQRYGRPEYIIEALVKLAKETPAPKEGKLASIMDYANSISNLVITVESMGLPDYLKNPQLLKELVDKLPDGMKLQWGEKVIRMGGRPTLKTFCDWIAVKAKAISAVATPKFSKLDGKKGKSTADVNTTDDDTTAVVEQQKSSQPEGSCPFCKQDGHKVPKCDKFAKLEVNRRWEQVKKMRLCFRCLRYGHAVKDCRSKAVCGVDSCQRLHHKLLHDSSRKKETPPAPSKKDGKEEESAAVEGCSRDVLLKFAPVKLGSGENTVKVFAVYDGCSTADLIEESLADELELDGPTDPLRLKWTNGMKQEHNNSKRVSLKIAGPDGGKQYDLREVRTVDKLMFTPQSYKVDKLVERWPHLKAVKMPDMVKARPRILLGQRHQYLFAARKIIEGGENAPMLTLTNLGWVLHGPVGGRSEEEETMHCEHETDDDIIHRLVKESFQIDSIGITSGAASSRSREDKLAEAKMEQLTRRAGQRWETGLLWKEGIIKLPESKSVALKRFYGIERKLKRVPELFLEYEAKIIDYLKKGYARKLSPSELAIESHVEWYLPHFGTFHPNKPKKLRIVFDAKSMSRGMSLNDALMTGPDLLVSLPGILLKFRQRRIAISGDIEEMFPQVRIRKEDCPAQRFLWRSNIKDEVDTYQLERMMFGSVCSPYCAQYVKNRNAVEFQKEFPAAVKSILDHHYMDDWIESCDTWQEADKLVQEVTEVHKRGGFRIGKWISNSEELLRKINPEAAANSKNLTEWSEIMTERVLGLHWNPQKDTFTFRVNLQRAGSGIDDGSRRPTKREVLRLIMLIFDPLGFLSHFLVKARIIMQQTWTLKLGWDDEITEEQFKKWKQWVQCLGSISKVAMPRCYNANATNAENIQLHIMADAGELAYCAIAFLRVDTGQEVEVMFVMAKSRVAPLKHVSIPRLELQAALVASRLGKFVREHLDLRIDKTVFWTDSKTVLHWIRSDSRRFHQFVANRIGEIHENSEVAQWKWVPTKDNVADDATRDGKADLGPGSRWWNGPAFLKLPEDDWPVESENVKLDDSLLEIRKHEQTCSMDHVPDQYLPKVNRFSKWTRLLRSTAYVLKFVQIMEGKFLGETVLPTLLPEDLEKAERLLVRSCQKEDYGKEIHILSTGGRIPSSSKLYNLSPKLDTDGVLIMDARTTGAAEEGLRKPMILHPHNQITKLIIMDYHVKALHQDQDEVRNEIRQKFYIPHLKEAVKRSWHECLECRKRRVKPMPPPMGHLPDFRVQRQPRCFTIVGMDYFGPLDVVIGRRHEKRYGVLFTCMNTRAVHLEIAHSLSTDSCIMAIRRMIGRRGSPKEVYSDNGINLRGADKEMRLALEEISSNHMADKLCTMGIKWNFIPPSAPHFGGTWERLVKSVKTAMGAIMKSRAVKEEVLHTIFVEVEAVLNSRPLADIPVEPGSREALTPMHFIIGSSSALQPPGEFDDQDLDLRKLWRRSQRIADMFWKRWVREYLPTLQRRTKWLKPAPGLEKGDMVIIIDESLKRNTWPLGMVTDTFPGSDGTTRVAEVKTAYGTYRRPVVKLAKLDIKAEVPSDG